MLLFALVGAVATLASSPGAVAQMTTNRVVEGAAIDGLSGTLFRFEVRGDGVVRIDDMGQADPSASPKDGIPEAADAPVSTIWISSDVLAMIQERSSEAEVSQFPSREFGFHLEKERLRLQFDQGLPIWVAVLTAVAVFAVGGFVVGLALTRRERKRKHEDAVARQRALHAREAERSRLAREIHDGPLQDVHALRMLSGGQVSNEVSEEASRIARELRAIAEGLRPPALGRFGLAAALSAHANRVKDRYSEVSVGLELDEDGTGPDALPDVVRSSLFRIAQESITNAIEHGRATRVHVRLSLLGTDGTIVLEVTDNGGGFPWSGGSPDLSDLADHGHFGLVGMYERVEAVGGTLTLSSDGTEGEGARVLVTLPDMRRTDGPRRPPRRPRLPVHV